MGREPGLDAGVHVSPAGPWIAGDGIGGAEPELQLRLVLTQLQWTGAKFGRCDGERALRIVVGLMDSLEREPAVVPEKALDGDDATVRVAAQREQIVERRKGAFACGGELAELEAEPAASGIETER